MLLAHAFLGTLLLHVKQKAHMPLNTKNSYYYEDKKIKKQI